MKVILLQDVAKIGTRYTVTDVADGYALNQLIPKGLAEPATPQNLKKLESRSASIEATKAADAEAFAAAKEKLAESTITVTVEANEQGHLFGAVKASEVVEAAKAAGVTIEEAQVIMEEPIKETGTHMIKLQGGEETAEVAVEVVAK